MNAEYERLKRTVDRIVEGREPVKLVVAFADNDKALMRDICKLLNEHGHTCIQYMDTRQNIYNLIGYKKD